MPTPNCVFLLHFTFSLFPSFPHCARVQQAQADAGCRLGVPYEPQGRNVHETKGHLKRWRRAERTNECWEHTGLAREEGRGSTQKPLRPNCSNGRCRIHESCWAQEPLGRREDTLAGASPGVASGQNLAEIWAKTCIKGLASSLTGNKRWILGNTSLSLTRPMVHANFIPKPPSTQIQTTRHSLLPHLSIPILNPSC